MEKTFASCEAETQEMAIQEKDMKSNGTLL